MNTTVKNDFLSFRDFYKSLNDKDKVELREKIIEECGFSLSSFYYKLTNNNFKKLEIEKIQDLIS